MGKIQDRIREEQRVTAAVEELREMLRDEKAVADLLWEMVAAMRHAREGALREQ